MKTRFLSITVIFALLFTFDCSAAQTKVLFGSGGEVQHPNGTIVTCPNESTSVCSISETSATNGNFIIGQVYQVSLFDAAGNMLYVKPLRLININGLPDPHGNYQGAQITWMNP